MTHRYASKTCGFVLIREETSIATVNTHDVDGSGGGGSSEPSSGNRYLRSSTSRDDRSRRSS